MKFFVLQIKKLLRKILSTISKSDLTQKTKQEVFQRKPNPYYCMVATVKQINTRRKGKIGTSERYCFLF